MMEDAGPLCMDCADLGHLEYLPAGNATLTRRATKLSRVSAVVVRWSRSRKRYERQGILAEPEAIEQAEAERLTEGEVRERPRLGGELHP
jgi:signal transduction histidine kinase